jgi:hypothetical protein
VLGQDRVCFEYCDQGRSGYGGIEKVVLSDSTLIVTLTQERAARFGIPRRICAELAVAHSERERLADGLQKMMPELLVRDHQQKE